MSALIYAYKGPIPFKRPASPNYGPSLAWAKAGYNGWPAAKAPPGDRPNCQPTCPKPYAGDPFTVNWHWLDGHTKPPTPTGNNF